MNKIILFLFLILLISGCINKSNEMCSFLKAAQTNENTTIRMEGEVCVLEDKDYETVLILKCSNFLTEFNLVLKYNNETNKTIINDLKDKCNVIGDRDIK